MWEFLNKIIKNESSEKGKVVFSVKTFILILFIVFAFGCYSVFALQILKNSKIAISQNQIDSDIKNMEILVEKYNNVADKKEKTVLENYNINTDKFNLPHISSYNSPGGVCSGYSLYEKLNYMAKRRSEDEKLNYIYNIKDGIIDEAKTKYHVDLNKNDNFVKNGIDLSKISISSEKWDDIKLKIQGSNKIKSINTEDMKTFYYNIYNPEENIKDMSIAVGNNEKLSNILNTTNYLQYWFNKNKHNFVFAKIEYDKDDSFDIEKFKKFFNKDRLEPVIIAVHNNQGGHALLAYGYTIVDENTYKIYVSDSNIPIINNDDLFNELGLNKYFKKKEEYNNYIENNIYILLKRENESSRWNYIYNPTINNQTYAYKCEYNSYIAGSYMEFFNEEYELFINKK